MKSHPLSSAPHAHASRRCFYSRGCNASPPHSVALLKCAAATFLIWLGMGGLAGAHGIVVDGLSNDWWGTQAAAGNLGRIARNASGQGEYVWRDVSGDERTDFLSPDSEADIATIWITGDTNGLAIFIASAAAPGAAIQAQVAIDLDRVAGSGQQWLAGSADTLVDTAAAWERLIQTRFASGGTATVLNTNFIAVASTPAARSANGIEIFVTWTNLGLAGPPTAPLRFTVATFRSAVNDQTLDIGGGSVANALDVVTTYGNPAASGYPNTWSEVSDQVINYFFDVYFQKSGGALAGEVYAPVLVDRLVSNSSTVNELVAVRNVSPATIDLGGFKIGDEETPDATEGMYRFPTNTALVAGTAFIVAQNGNAFVTNLGYAPEAEFTATSTEIVDLTKYTPWTSGTWALANAGDEIVLLDAADTIVDVVAYGTSTYAGITSMNALGVDELFRRAPAERDTDNCGADFVSVGALAAPLKITAVSATNSQLRLTWQDVAADYVVEVRTNLTTGSWQPVPGATWPLGGNSWTTALPASHQQFYRVKRY